MNFPVKRMLSFCKQLISSVLSITLLVNLSAPLAAQSYHSADRRSRIGSTVLETQVGKAVEQAAFQAARDATVVDTSFQDRYLEAREKYQADPVIKQLTELRKVFIPDHSVARLAFERQYNAEVQSQIDKTTREIKNWKNKQLKYIEDQIIQARYAKVSESQIKAWKEREVNKVNEAEKESLSKLSAWEMQIRSEKDKYYEEYEKNLAQNVSAEPDKNIAYIKQKIRELMALYAKAPEKAQPFLIDISSAVLLADGRRTTWFTKEEKDLLRRLYKEEIKTNSYCKKADTEGLFRSCAQAMSAVSGLGILGDGFEDSQYISQFIEDTMQTPNAPGALLTGMSALLAMQAYDAVRGVLETATQLERKASWADFDISFTAVVNGVVKLSTSSYLGKVSQWAQFPVAVDGQETTSMSTAPMGNAWEEVAYMLAEEGSDKALSILSDYGVNTCVVRKGNFVCGGINPFIVGAITSGKSSFTGKVSRTAPEGWSLDADGRGQYTSAEMAEMLRNTALKTATTATEAAAALNLTVPQAIARAFYFRDMGDLDAESQLFLDQKLFAFVDESTNKQRNVLASNRIKKYDRNSPDYKAKQRSQHRIETLRNVAALLDVPLYIYFAFDLVRLGLFAVNMGRTAFLAAKMARADVAVAARTKMLWDAGTARALTKLERTLPASIKGGMGSVVSVMPEFTSARPLISVAVSEAPKVATVHEAALSTVKAVGEGLVVDGTKVGALAKEAGTVVRSSVEHSGWEVGTLLGSSGDVAGEVAEIQRSLDLAVARTNEAFLNRKGVSLLQDPHAWYRGYLSKELARMPIARYRGYNAGIAADFAAGIRANKAIQVPERVLLEATKPLIDKAGIVDRSMLRTLVGGFVGVWDAYRENQIVNAIEKAQAQTGLAYTHRGFFGKVTGTVLGKNKSVYNTMLTENLLSLTESREVLGSFTTLQKDNILRTLATSIRAHNVAVPSNLSQFAAVKYSRAKLSFETVQSSLFSAQTGTEMLPFTFRIDGGVTGLNRSGQYQRVVFTPRGGSNGQPVQYFMGLTDGLKKPTNLSNFKIDIPSAQLPNLIRGAAEAGLATPIEIKMAPYTSARAVRKAARIGGETFPATAASEPLLQRLGAMWRNKTKIWTDQVPVFIRTADGREVLAPVLLKVDTQLGFAGSRFVLDSNNKLHLFQAGQDLFGKHRLRFSLPKQQITPLVNLGKAGVFKQPLRLTVNSGRNKLLPLYFATGLSLSSASVGLIAPLETTYRDRVTDVDKTLISLAFPYLPSLFAPALSPIVMRYGALRMVQASLGLVAVGLAFTWIKGFNGNLDQTNLPPIWPLFVSGTAIGISSALSRSGLNVLIDTMGGGGSLLKSMAFKNMGSLLLLAPSFVYGAAKLGAIKRNSDGLSEEELQKKLATPATDFSLAFPVLTTVTLAVLAYLSSARIDPGIGRAGAVLKGQPMNFGKEMVQSWKTIFAPEVLPLASAAFFFTGFEAAAFSKASNQAIKPIYQNAGFVKNSVEGNQKNLVSLLTGGTVALMPFITRMVAKPTLRALSDPMKPAIEYKRMLALSYTMNTAGGLLLWKYGTDENPKLADMILGIGLMGFGTANVTQSLQKLANIKVGSGVTIAKLTEGMEASAAAQRAAELKTMTMTGFSWSQIGLAAIPLLQSSYVDKEVAAGMVPQGSAQGPLSSLWIPLTSLMVSFALASGSLGVKVRVPKGAVGGTKLVVDGPESFNPVPVVRDAMSVYRDREADQMQQSIEQKMRFEETKQQVQAEREEAMSAKRESNKTEK